MRRSLTFALVACTAFASLGLAGCCCPRRRCPEVVSRVVRDPGAPPVPVAEAPEPAASPRPADPTPTETPVPGAADEARPFDAAAAGVAVHVPRGWKSRWEEEYTFLLEGPLRIPTAALFEPRARTPETAAAELARELEEGIDAVRVTRAPRPATFAGYPALVAEGTGATDGVKLYWRAWVVSGSRLFVAAVATPAMMWKLQKSRIRTFEQAVQRRPDTP